MDVHSLCLEETTELIKKSTKHIVDISKQVKINYKKLLSNENLLNFDQEMTKIYGKYEIPKKMHFDIFKNNYLK